MWYIYMVWSVWSQPNIIRINNLISQSFLSGRAEPSDIGVGEFAEITNNGRFYVKHVSYNIIISTNIILSYSN